MKKIATPLGVLLCTVGTLVVTALTTSGALGGRSLNTRGSGDFSPALVLPAGYAFAIWGIIYPGLLVYAVYQFLPGQRANPRFRAAAPWLVINCVLNALWLPLAYYGYKLLPLVVLFGYLVTLVFITQGLRVGQEAVSRTETWLARVPFGIYFGWVTVACAVATADWLKSSGVGGLGLGEPAWAVGLLLIVGAIGLAVYRRFPNRAYLLVVTWAGVAIGVLNRPVAVRLTAAAVAVAAAAYTVPNYSRKATTQPPNRAE